VRECQTEVNTLRKQLQDSEREKGQLQKRLLEAEDRITSTAASTSSPKTQTAEAAEDLAPVEASGTKANLPVVKSSIEPDRDGKGDGEVPAEEGDRPPGMTGSTVASDATANGQDVEVPERERDDVALDLPGTVASLAELPPCEEQPAGAGAPQASSASTGHASEEGLDEAAAARENEEKQDLVEGGVVCTQNSILTPGAAQSKVQRDQSSTVDASSFAETPESRPSASQAAAPACCSQCAATGERLYLDDADLNRYCQRCWTDFYGAPPNPGSSSRIHHLVDVEVEQYWLDDDLAQLWTENQLIGWPPAVHPLVESPGTEPEVWSTVNVRMRRGVVGPHARETIHGDRPHHGEILANKYRISRSVGEGHFTKAFLAEDTTSGTSVCLKRHRNLSVEALADLMVIGRRLDEVDLGGGLFPKLLDAFYDLVGYTVECLVEGRNCLVVLQRDRTFFQIMDNLRVVAHGGLRGLMYLDRAGVVHNDVKPDNIIWVQAPMHHGVPVETPTVQIVDFGCARLDQREDAGRNWSLAEGGAGHLGKWSPEMALRLPITHRGDVWGIAVSLCELHCGRFVWHCEADTAEVVLAQALGICGLHEGVPSSLLRKSPLDIRVLYTPAPRHLPLRRNPLGQLEALQPRRWGLEQVLGEGWREGEKAAFGELLQAALVMDPAHRPAARELLETCSFAAPLQASVSEPLEPDQ
jgi:serine/threonine protein kinase